MAGGALAEPSPTSRLGDVRDKVGPASRKFHRRTMAPTRQPPGGIDVGGPCLNPRPTRRCRPIGNVGGRHPAAVLKYPPA